MPSSFVLPSHRGRQRFIMRNNERTNERGQAEEHEGGGERIAKERATPAPSRLAARNRFCRINGPAKRSRRRSGGTRWKHSLLVSIFNLKQPVLFEPHKMFEQFCRARCLRQSRLSSNRGHASGTNEGLQTATCSIWIRGEDIHAGNQVPKNSRDSRQM